MNTLQLEYRVNEQGMVLEYLNRFNRMIDHSKHLFTEDVNLKASQDMEDNHSLTEEEHLK